MITQTELEELKKFESLKNGFITRTLTAEQEVEFAKTCFFMATMHACNLSAEIAMAAKKEKAA